MYDTNSQLEQKTSEEDIFVDQNEQILPTTQKKKEIQDGIYIGLMVFFGLITIACIAAIVTNFIQHYHPKYTVPTYILTESEYIVTIKSTDTPDIDKYLDEPIGVLRCDKWDLNVTLKYSNKQSICDEENVATNIPADYGIPIIGQPGYALIGDHNSQSFWNLQYASIGDKLYIETFYGQFVYKVTDIQYGTSQNKNTGESTGIITDDGADLKDICNDTSKTGVVLYTCYPYDAKKTDQRAIIICEQIEGTILN